MKRNIKKIIFTICTLDNYLLILLIFLVFITGIFYSFYLGNNLRYPDERDYYHLANNIVFHRQYSLDGELSTACRPPGYPLFLSFFILLGADIIYLRILNFIVLGLCIYLIFKILEKQSSRLSATVAAVLIVCYPVLFYTAGTLYPQTFGSFLFLLIIFLLMRNTNSNLIYAICGLLFGYLILTILSFFFTLFVFTIWFYKRAIGVKKRSIIITIAIPLILMGVWCLRNYVVLDGFVGLATNSGGTLLLGNSENTTSNEGATINVSKYLAEARKLQLNEATLDVYYRSKAIEWIVAHKTQALKLFCLKFLNYFNYRNVLWTKTDESSVKDLVMFITYFPLLLLFACRILLIKAFRLSSFEALLIILYFSNALFYAIFITKIRYRLPFDFLLIAVVAIFISKLLINLGLIEDESKFSKATSVKNV